MQRTQANRGAAVYTPLGSDALLLRRMTGTEKLGRPFEYELDLLSEDWDIDFDAILGQPIGIRLELPDHGTRYFSGFVSRFVQAPQGGLSRRLAGYRATVVPWIWLLTRNSDCRIFQEKTIPQIILEVFRDHGMCDFDNRLTSKYAVREYCVQYRETDFDFVHRLMEHEGIYYYFEHEADKHTLVLCDAIAAHRPVAGYERVVYRPENDHEDVGIERITHWSMQRQVQSGIWSSNDFDFKAPRKMLRNYRNNPRPHGNSHFERYDYPGDYLQDEQGQHRCRVRHEEMDARHEVATGHADARGLAAGHTFKLAEYPREDQNREYLITSASVTITNDEYDSSASGEGGLEYGCTFNAIDVRTPFRPERMTPRAKVEGPQTAIVTGPPEEEIHTDKYGRVKVQFHWDRYGGWDQDSSCWIRVSQTWAGKGWGGMLIPRIGQEVIVDFLEGDPDRPIITGRVYNSDNPVPYDLPANKTVSTLKSNSSKGGAGNNEIKFEDSKDHELFFIHAQRDREAVIEHNNTESVGNNEQISVAANRTKSVGGNETTDVAGNRTESVGKDESVSIGLDRTLTVGANNSESVGANESRVVAVNQSVTVGANQTTTIGANESNAVASNQNTTVGMCRSSSIGLMDSISAGLVQDVNAGIAISINAGVSIVLAALNGQIRIGPDGVFIKGSKVVIEGDRVDINP